MKIRNVALQAKVKSARHNGAHAALKVILLTDFHRGVSCSTRRHGRRQSRDSHHFIRQVLWFTHKVNQVLNANFIGAIQGTNFIICLKSLYFWK